MAENLTTGKQNARPEREEQAHREIGVTEITRTQIRVVSVLALLGLFAVPVVQCVHDVRSGRMPAVVSIVTGLRKAAEADGVMAANRAALHEIDRFENELEDNSLLTKGLLPPAQVFLNGVGGIGNEEAYTGSDDWIYYRPGIDSLIGPPFLSMDRIALRAKSRSETETSPLPDPIPAILDFGAQLRERGIEPIIMPAPSKAQIHPERFSAGYAELQGVIHNPSYREFVDELAQPELVLERYSGLIGSYGHIDRQERARMWYGPLIDAVGQLPDKDVEMFDASAILAARKADTGKPQYLAGDTHWRPEAMEEVARLLAERISPNLSSAVGEYTRVEEVVTNLGDVVAMLQLPEGQDIYSPETVTVQKVKVDGRSWKPDRSAEVLLLGDSFCNIYSLGSMGWGAHAGFAEQLSFALKRPVDVIIRNDSGAFSTRRILLRELASDPSRLAGKKVVVWEFAERELSVGDWKILSPMESKDQKQSSRGEREWVSLDEQQVFDVTAEVMQSSDPPNTSAPYRDHIMTFVLGNLKSLDEQAPVKGDTAYVAMMSMRDNHLLPAAYLRPGDIVELKLANYDRINSFRHIQKLKSSELDDEELFDVDLLWGEALVDEPVELPVGWQEYVALLLTLALAVGAVLAAERRERREV